MQKVNDSQIHNNRLTGKMENISSKAADGESKAGNRENCVYSSD